MKKDNANSQLDELDDDELLRDALRRKQTGKYKEIAETEENTAETISPEETPVEDDIPIDVTPIEEEVEVIEDPDSHIEDSEDKLVEEDNPKKNTSTIQDELEQIKEEKVQSKKKKSKRALLNILLISFIIIMGLFIIVMFTGGGDNEDVTTEPSKSEIKEGEAISVQKAKEIVEDANSHLEEATSENTYGGNESTEAISLLDEDISSDTNSTPNENGQMNFADIHNGISFTYPTEWMELFSFTTKPVPMGVKNAVMVGYPADSKIIDNMRISIEGTPLSISAKKYFTETEGVMEQTFHKFQLIKKGETTVAGGEAPYRIYSWIPETEENFSPYEKDWLKIKQYQVYVAGKEKVYVVTFTAEDKLFNKNFKKYEEILSSLELEKY